jgi:hypothetical protein
MIDDVIKNGVIGSLAGWRLNGKSYDAYGNYIDEVHEPECFCCRANLLG